MDVILDLQPGIIWTYRAALAYGLLITLWLTVSSTAAGLSAGIAFVFLEQLGGRPLRWIVTAYVETFRNTPLLVQLMWIHFALPMITGVPLTPLQSGTLALSLSAAAYFTEIIRGGVEAVPKGQIEGAAALGLRRWHSFQLIILPQALRIMLPPLTNLVIAIFKGTTVVSLLSVGELLQVVNRIGNFTFRSIEIFTFSALVYLLVGTLLDMAAKKAELRLSRSSKDRRFKQ